MLKLRVLLEKNNQKNTYVKHEFMSKLLFLFIFVEKSDLTMSRKQASVHFSDLCTNTYAIFLKILPEFIDVGKPARALDTLQEVFRNKKFTYTWSESVIEPIMFKYLDLCVELKKSHIAKEGLFQYRNMFQLVSASFIFYSENSKKSSEYYF